MDIPIAMLQYFCVLAEELHYGRAAQRLGIASPSLSQQISRLEDRLGARLLERGPRHVRLTAAGAELLPLADEVRRAHRKVIDWSVRRREGPDALLRIGLVAAGAGALTTSILGAMLSRAPDVRLEVRRLGFFDVVDALLSNRVDVAFAPAPLAAPTGVVLHTILEEGRVLVVPSGHRLAGRGSVSIAETDDEVFIAPAPDDAGAVDTWLVDPRPSGRSPTRGPSADDIEGILELVATGVGVNIAAASAAAHYRREGLAFVPIHDVPIAEILLCRRAGDDAPSVKAFERIALEVARTAAENRRSD